MHTLKAALENAASSFGEADRRTQNWQIQLNKAQAELNDMERELSQNNKALDTTEEEFREADRAAEQFAKGIEHSSREAAEAGGRFDKLGAGLSKFGGMAASAAAAVGAAAIAAGTALAGATVSAAGFADDILTQSAQTGIATDTLQEYKYAAELVDVPLETLTNSMAKNIRSMSSARDGTGDAAKAYAALGISVTDANGNLRDGEAVYWQAIDALGKVSNETERDALSMQLFGKSAQDLNPLIAQGAAKMQELGKQAHAAGYVMSGETLAAFGEFDDKLQTLKVGAEGAKNALGTVLLPVLSQLAGEGTELLSQFTSGIMAANGDMDQIGDVIAGIVPQIIDTIAELLPTLMETGVKIIGAIGQSLLDNLPMLVDAAVQLATTIVQGLIEALPQVVDGALQLVMALAQGITDALPRLIPAAVKAVLTIVQGLVDNIPELIKTAIDMIMALRKGILDALPELIKQAPVIVKSLVDGLIEAIPLLIDAQIEMILQMVDFFTNPDNLITLVTAAIEIVVAIVNGLIRAIPKLIAGAEKLVSALWDRITHTDWLKLGADILAGIAQGLINGVASIGSTIAGVAGSIVDGFKSFFGIHSPSALFRDEVGAYLAQGIGVGFSGEMQRVARDMRNAVPMDFSLAGGFGTPAFAGMPAVITHTGTIRVEGVADSGQLSGVVDILIRELQKEVRR